MKMFRGEREFRDTKTGDHKGDHAKGDHTARRGSSGAGLK